MMETATWLAMAILGPGSCAVFIWFLVDLGAMLTETSESESRGGGGMLGRGGDDTHNEGVRR